jgi:hypothetical protein
MFIKINLKFGTSPWSSPSFRRLVTNGTIPRVAEGAHQRVCSHVEKRQSERNETADAERHQAVWGG